jgi:putative SOS response-associated peptidase YedK
MCGRYVQAKTTIELAEAFDATDKTAGAGVSEPPQSSWNVAPTMELPVVVRREDARELRTMRWGLVPSWAKDLSIGARLINARAETLATKPAFRSALSRRRCLVPADGWYEWMVLGSGPDGRARKQPFWISTYAVITTPTTDELGVVHDRSPVPLEPVHWDVWLDTSDSSTTAADLSLLCPIEPGLVVGRPVSTAVGNVRNDDPNLLDELPIE